MPLLSTARTTQRPAQPLPVSNQLLTQAGVLLRLNQFSLLAAAPGVGKSLLASNLAIRTQCPSVYFSADSDEWTVKTRAASIITGYPLESIDKWLSQGGTSEQKVLAQLAKSDHVDWCFRSALDLDFIAYRLKAYQELWGAGPKLVVIDNLGNAVEDSDNKYSELETICREVQAFARNTGAHFLGLHHVMGAKENGDQPIGLGDLLGKIGKIPELVMGLNRVEGEQSALNLTVPKNRGGKAGQHIKLPVDYGSAFIGGWKSL